MKVVRQDMGQSLNLMSICCGISCLMVDDPRGDTGNRASLRISPKHGPRERRCDSSHDLLLASTWWQTAESHKLGHLLFKVCHLFGSSERVTRPQKQ